MLVLLVAAVYFAVAKVGLSFADDNEIVSAVWPPSGVGLAAVFMLGYRVLPGVAVAALVSNLTDGSALGVSAGIALGNTLAAAFGAWMLGRAGFRPNLRKVKDVLALALLGAALAPALNATIGNATLLVAGVLDASDLWAGWRVWWLGDLTGVLLCAPPVFLLLNGREVRLAPHRKLAEASVALALLAGVTMLLLRDGVTLVYPVFPLLVLIAMRYRQVGAVIAAPLVSILCIQFTGEGTGPFIGGDPADELLRAQLFVALAALTALMVAAARSEWEQSEAALSELAESRTALAEAQELAHIGSWEWELAADSVTWTEELYRIFGVEHSGPRANFDTYIARIHPDDKDRTIATIMGAVEADAPFHMEHRIIRADGEVRNLDCHGRFTYDSDGKQLRMIGTAQDVTSQRRAEEQLSHLAMHDPLTGLANRSLFLERLREALDRKEEGRSVAVLYCDLDDFKNVNDSLGHETGDRLLAALPPRLEEAVNPGNTVARFGGDEFVVLLDRIKDQNEAIQVASQLSQAFSRPIRVGGRVHDVSASIGVVFAEPGEITASEVLRDADAAMYRAKSSGRGQVSLFDERLRSDLVERIGIEVDLRGAVGSGQLALEYQPVYSVGDGQLAAVEALLRWRHPEKGLLQPDAFIEVAERVGLIGELGIWVLENACRDAAAWLEATGRNDLTVSVNLSATQISDPGLSTAIERALEANGLRPGHLAIEITESALLEQGPLPKGNMRRLHQLGVRLVIDDFGTGYSSLSYLKRIPFDILKIDREFIGDLGERPEDAAIVEAILSIARSLDFQVVAEGVETKEQFDWLRALGCPYAQGFYFTEAMSLEDLIENTRPGPGGRGNRGAVSDA